MPTPVPADPANDGFLRSRGVEGNDVAPLLGRAGEGGRSKDMSARESMRDDMTCSDCGPLSLRFFTRPNDGAVLRRESGFEYDGEGWALTGVRGGTGEIAIDLLCMLLGLSSYVASDQTRLARRVGMGGLSSVAVSMLTGYEYVAVVVLFRMYSMPRGDGLYTAGEMQYWAMRGRNGQ